MAPFIGTLLGNFAISFGVIIIIFFIKGFKNKFISYIDYITALTVGILVAIVFLGFIPEIIENGNVDPFYFGFYIILGILTFYTLELFLHWHHCKDLGHNGCLHKEEMKEIHSHSNLMFVGTFFHNALHGIILFNAFSINVNFGIITTIAIFMHSIPLNISNYFMNHNNIKHSYIAASGGFFGALLTYPFIEFLIEKQFVILLIISGGILYTALTDILPEVMDKSKAKAKFVYLLFIIIGILSFLGFSSIIGYDNHEGNQSIESHI